MPVATSRRGWQPRHSVQHEPSGQLKRKPLSLRWDNAPVHASVNVVESLFGTLKQELVHRCRFATREAARREVFDYIEVWYNRQRRHSSLGYVSPAEFERKALAEATRVGSLSSTCA